MTDNRIKGSNAGNVVQAGHIGHVVIGSPAPKPTILSNVSASNGFVGRSNDLSKILGFLDPATTGSTTNAVLLSGSPGVGKTAVARQAGHVAFQRGWFTAGVLYFDLSGFSARKAVTADEALDGLMSILCPEQKLKKPGGGVRETAVGSRLAEIEKAGRSLLIIADNVADVDVARVFRCVGGVHRLILVSRYKLPLHAVRVVTLGLLPADEAVDLVSTAVRIAEPDDQRTSDCDGEMSQLVELCDRLPLALAIAAQILVCDSHETVGALVGRLVHERDRLDELMHDGLEYDGEHAVRAAFEASYALLSPAAAHLFRLMSLNSGPTGTVSAIAALAGTQETEARQLLRVLLRAHLVERISTQETYQMHDLLQLYSREKSETVDSPAARDAAVLALVEYFKNNVLGARVFTDPMVAKVRQRSEVFLSRKDAYAWLNLEMVNLPGAVRLAVSSGHGKAAVRMMQGVFHLVRSNGWDGWRLTSELALEAALAHGTDLDQLDAFEYAGDAAMYAGDARRAVDCFEGAAKSALACNEFVRQAFAVYRAGKAMSAISQYKEAMECYHEALRVQSEHGGDFGFIRIHEAIAVAHRREGEFHEASEHLRAAWHLNQITRIRPGVGRGYVSQGAAVGDLELQLAELANTDHRLSLDYRRAFSDQYGDAHTYLNLAEAYEGMGHHAEALRCAHEAVIRFEKAEAFAELRQARKIHTRIEGI